MTPREIAELGIESPDRLAQHLGASLIDHIDELDVLTDEHTEALKLISRLERKLDELEADYERLALKQSREG
tara:strand:+ start:41 stop:256 length:216 start_codon:yes stop_codon:yes gene_type:complete